MKNHVHRLFGGHLIGFLALIVGWSISQAQETSVAGIYSLIEVNGQKLPAELWIENSDGTRCKQVVVEGALLLDSEGRSASFITERVVCPNEEKSEAEATERSTMFPGSYKASGNQITVEDDFGTDHAVLEGDLLAYKTGEGGPSVIDWVFRRD
jgi:predicted phage-related endonuclease